MGLFSWFKKKQVEAETANLDIPLGKRNQEESDREALQGWPEMGRNDHELEVAPRVKIKAIFSNKVLTVFLPGGDMLTNTDASKELFVQVQNASTETEVRKLMLDLEAGQDLGINNLLADSEIAESMSDIVGTGEFTEKGGALYLNGIDVSIPRLLALEIIKAGKQDTNEYYESLKNFWCWCVLNPDNVAREDLFGFLERGDFKITRNGFFIGYRNVEEKSKKKDVNASLTAFISDKYLNIKTKQKKSPKNFEVYEDSEHNYQVIKLGAGVLPTTVGRIGNLAELYTNLSTLEDNEYTDNYTRTMTIKIGVPVKMDRSACDNDPNSDCSRGLHIKNKHYGGGSGNVAILVAVNPMNVVAVPNHTANKMRVCEYMPLGVIGENWEKWVEDADTLSLEEEYAVDEAKSLYELAKSSASKDEAVKKLMGGSLLVNQVINTLDIGAAISSRVKEVQ